jgi:DNA mismatch repair protein MutS2
LMVAMAQAGLHLPVAEGSALSIFDGIYADIGDEQSIEQSLSTFSSHLTNIVSILDQADSRSLVLLDELGAGTDPVEGSALARAILSHLLERQITTLVATHYSELKAYAHMTPGVENASVEFDLETLAPTYRMQIGLPGRSNAFAIAQRLGLSSGIIQQARVLVSPEELETESLLAEIQEAHRAATAARDEAVLAQRQRRSGRPFWARLGLWPVGNWPKCGRRSRPCVQTCQAPIARPLWGRNGWPRPGRAWPSVKCRWSPSPRHLLLKRCESRARLPWGTQFGYGA